MNRIILAYAPENAALADTIDQSLSRIGIPFEHANANVAQQIAAAGEPVLLLVTDNFLINRRCMEGLLPVLQTLTAERKLVVVLADGINANGQPVPTQIDRMANALHYMQHWQDTWLALGDRHQQLEGVEKAALTPELDAIRSLANQVGDLISTLREAGYMTLEQFEANDFEAFFRKFNLADWHGQYKRLVAQLAENQALEPSVHLPEMPVAGGLLAPEPMPETYPELEGNIQETASPVTTTGQPMPSEPETELAAIHGQTEIQQAAQDAWFWIEKGHTDRGLELFKIAMEQYPASDWLKSEFQRASRQINLSNSDQQSFQPISPSAPQTPDEAKSYDIMGDMAVERGDYLFAKYCWDRVSEIDPKYPRIFRKLGLMTVEHLRDYRETANTYLRKALEADPQDQELKNLLSKEAINQSVSSPQASDPPIPMVLVTPPSMPSDQAQTSLPKTETPQNKTLVLITGATSGIGRATAEIFARNGYRLILTGRRLDRLVELKSRFEAEYGTDILLLQFDVRNQPAVEAALSNLPESFQEIDILVNNAGLAKGLAPIHEGNLDHWEAMIDTNLKGLLYVTHMITPGMVRRRKGHIINLGSSASKEAYPNGNVYCATKFAVEALTKSMRFDLHAHNVRVSQVSPGHVEETEFAITRFDGDAERAKIYNDFQPLKSSDVAEVIYFMATRPPHVNIQDIQLFATQQASSMVINRSGR